MKRAAAELNTVQSNVTTRIRHLEHRLGVPLFERQSSGIKLTPAGVRLLPYAYEVGAAISNAQKALADRGTPCGPLVIGSRKSTSALHLAQILSAYSTAYPEVDVRVKSETSPVLTSAVLDRKLEAAFVANPIEHPDLVYETIFDEELVVLTAAHVESLDILSRDSTRIIVLGQGSLYEQQLKNILERRGFEMRRVMELGTLENIMECVSMGMGITLLPSPAVNARRNSVKIHSLNDDSLRVQTFFIRRRDGYVSSALSAFVSCARVYAKGLDAPF